jgi:hypothetical protein
VASSADTRMASAACITSAFWHSSASSLPLRLQPCAAASAVMTATSRAADDDTPLPGKQQQAAQQQQHRGSLRSRRNDNKSRSCPEDDLSAASCHGLYMFVAVSLHNAAADTSHGKALTITLVPTQLLSSL